MCTILFRLWRKALIALLTIIVVGCATTATVQSGEDIQKELELPEYNGPKAPVAVGPCEDKTGGRGEFTVETSEGKTEVSVDGEIGDGMKDMLVTALVNSGRFQVLESNAAVMDAMEREREIQDSTNTHWQMQAAELVVTRAVTRFSSTIEVRSFSGGFSDSVGDTMLGLNLLGGVSFPLESRMKPFAQARLTLGQGATLDFDELGSVETEGGDFLTSTVGLLFSL